MPIFESQEPRNKRLLEHVATQAISLISERIEGPSMQRVSIAWIIGGNAAALCVLGFSQHVRETWGKGDEQKATALVKVFTLQMMSFWYDNLSRQLQWSEKQRREVCFNAATNMLMLFGEISESAVGDLSDEVRDFMNMDTQFHLGWAGEGVDFDSLLPLASLLLARACEACGQRCIDWNRVALPVKSWEKLLQDGAIRRDTDNPFQVLMAWRGVCECTKYMYDYYDEVSSRG